MRLPRAAVRRFAILGVVYLLFVSGVALVLDTATSGSPFLPVVVSLAFALETTDSAAGMGFGTGLAPLLFVLGYEPLQVVPALLLSETLTGLIAGVAHHNVQNVEFSLRPVNAETKLLAVLVVTGSAGVLGSVVLTYFTFRLPDSVIEIYVSVLVMVMGVVGVLRARLRTRIEYSPGRLAAFALLAGINKGVGGGGYGPVVTLGQIISGVYEKSAVAITTLAEGIVSTAGVFAFFVLLLNDVPVDLRLLPSIMAGGFLAAIIAPYLVRVVPNEVWRYLIPLYAFGVGVVGLAL